MDEPKDICCICGAVGDSGTFTDVNEEDFELLCPDCKDRRCNGCELLCSKMKLRDERFFCRHRGNISYPSDKVCDFWTERTENYTPESTIDDYA